MVVELLKTKKTARENILGEKAGLSQNVCINWGGRNTWKLPRLCRSLSSGTLQPPKISFPWIILVVLVSGKILKRVRPS